MNVFGYVVNSYRRAHTKPHDLRPSEAAEAGLDVRDQIDALSRRVDAHGLWAGMFRHFWRHMVVYLLFGIGVVAAGPAVPWAIEATLTALDGDGSVVGPALVLTVVASGFTLLRWVSTWQVRMLVYRIDLSVQRLIFRRLQRTDPRWLAGQEKSSTSLLLEYPQQLSQSAFAAEFIVYGVLIVGYVVALLVWYGLVGVAVVTTVALGTFASRAVIDRMTLTTKEYVDGDHRRSALVDVLVSAWQPVRRQQLEPVVAKAFGDIRRAQRGYLVRRARRSAWEGVLSQALPQVVIWSAVASGLWFATDVGAGAGIALLVLVRMLLSAVGDNLATYANVRFGIAMGADVTNLLTKAPAIVDSSGGDLPAGTVTISGSDADITVRPGERIAVIGRDRAELSRLLEQISGVPSAEPGWVTALSGTPVLVARGQPVFDGPIAEVVTLWQRPIDRDAYVNAFVHSGLVEDVTDRADGDAAELSSTTERLSDGQVVRASVAQALYLDPDVLLLDDVFAPLDPQRAAQVAADVLAEGPATRIFTTTRLELAGHADRFLVVSDGRLVTLPVEELGERREELAELLGAQLTAELDAVMSAAPVQPREHAPIPDGLTYGFPEEYVPPHASAFEAPAPAPRAADLWRNVRGLFSPFAMVAIGVLIVAGIAAEYGLAYLVDRGIADGTALWWLSGLVAASIVVFWLRSYLPLRAPIGAIDRVHTGLVRGLFAGRFDDRHSAMTGRLSRDFFDLELRIPSRLAGFAGAWLSVVAATAAVLAAGWWTIVPLLVLATLGVWAYRAGRKALIASTQLTAACRGPLLNFARNALGTPGFHASPSLRAALSNRFDDLGAIRAVGILRKSWVQLRTLLTVELLGLAVFLVALWSIVATGGSTMVAAGVIVYAAYAFAQQIASLVEGMQEIDGTMLTVGRVADMLGSPALPTRAALRTEVPALVEDIARDDLGTDGPTPSDVDGPAIHAEGVQPHLPKGIRVPAPLDLTATAGTLTVLTGPSGVGKSTLLKTLAGVAPPASGTVLHAGSAPSRQVRAHFRYADSDLPPLPVPSGTLLAAYADTPALLAALCDATDIDVVTADQELDKLGHAQRQVVNLARAFADRPALVFLDEATSAMDAHAERLALRTVREYAPDTAIVAVLHRAANQDLADRAITITPDTAALST